MSLTLAGAALISGLAGAGVGAASSLGSGIYNHWQYKDQKEWQEQMMHEQMDYQTNANQIAMDFNAAEAEKARQWSAEMSSTEMRRRMADLKAAGLNPILALNATGASTPGATSAQGVTSSGAGVSPVSSKVGSSLAALGSQAISSATDIFMTYAALTKAGVINQNTQRRIGF